MGEMFETGRYFIALCLAISGFSVICCLIILGFCLKIYTEILKDKSMDKRVKKDTP